MDIEITNETDEQIEFELHDSTPAFANALRRTMIGNVPTLAIEEVRITKNNTGLFDEIIAHRLGLVPWEFDHEKYEYDPEAFEADEDDDEETEDDIRNTVHMALTANGEGTITAGDISVSAEDVAAANPDMMVARLQEDGHLEFEATAKVGLGKHHAKWQAANAAYSYDDGEDTFHFTVETTSGLSPRTVVSQAVARLQDELTDFEESVEAHL